MMIIGKREAEEGQVSLRSRSNPELDGPKLIVDAVQEIMSEITSKALPKTRTPTN